MRRDIPRNWLKHFEAKEGMGAAICEGQEITAACEEFRALRNRVARLEGVVQTLLDEDPNEQIADNGSTVLCAWRYDARRALEEK